MGLFDNLLGSTQQQQDYQGFVDRYNQGHPSQGYSDQEVMNRYQQVAPQLPQQDYYQAAQEAFSRLSPQERMQFAQELQQQAQSQGVNVPGFDQPNSSSNFQDPSSLAQMVSGLHQQQPGLLGQLLGGGGGSQGGGMFSSPVAKAALAGIAAMAVKNVMGGMGGGQSQMGGNII